MLALTRRLGEALLIDAGESGVVTVVVAEIRTDLVRLLVASPTWKPQWVEVVLDKHTVVVAGLYVTLARVSAGRCRLAFGGDKLPVWRAEALLERRRPAEEAVPPDTV